MTLQRWAAGSDELDASVDRVFQRYSITIVLTILAVVSHIVLLVMLVHDMKDKRLYWLTVPGGIFNWLVRCCNTFNVICSLTTIPPTLPHPSSLRICLARGTPACCDT